MPIHSKITSSNTNPLGNQNTSQPHTIRSQQNHIGSNQTPNSPDSTSHNTPMHFTQGSATMPLIDPAIVAEQEERDIQLSKMTKENLAPERYNLQLQERDLQLQEQILGQQSEIANPKEQIFRQEETIEHIQRGAYDAAECQKLELFYFKAKVFDGLREPFIERIQVEDEFASDSNAALQSRKKDLQNCDHLADAAIRELQESEDVGKDKAQTPTEQPKEVFQPRGSIYGNDSSSHDKHSDQSIIGSHVASAKIVEGDGTANSTASSPRAPDKASKKRSAESESSAKAVSEKGDAAKRVKTADHKSPGAEEATVARTYPAVHSLLGKDDATCQIVLGQIDQNGLQ